MNKTLMLMLALSAPVAAQQTPGHTTPGAAASGSAASGSAASGPAASGDVDMGRQLADGKVSGVVACSSCHGAHGEGNPSGGFPRLAGQSPEYLARQLTLYADGRQQPVMSPIAKQLSPDQMRAAGAYYAGLSAAPAGPAKAPDRASLSRGQTLAAVGDNGLRVQACGNCHGPQGIGEFPVYPYLAGQNSGYLVAALNAWKTGARKTDPSQQMNDLASHLSDRDIAAVAAYYAQQVPPAPTRSDNPALMAKRTPSGPTGGASARAPAGVGTEGGAATTGGDQGPGGGGGASGAGAQGSPSGATPP